MPASSVHDNIEACPDIYEPDNTYVDASAILANGAPQTHTFYPTGDLDWISFEAEAGRVYTSTTFNLVLDTDTVLRLYDTDGMTLLAANDDDPSLPDPLASRIRWMAPGDGRYYLRVNDFYGRGDCLGYDIRVEVGAPMQQLYLPAVWKSAVPPPTPTPTNTPTPTPSNTPTDTPTPTPTNTPTNTPTDTPTPTPSNTPTNTPTPTPTPVVNTWPIFLTGLDAPNALAVNPLTERVYITSRDNDRLLVMDGATNQIVADVATGDSPFGVAVNPVTNKAYAAAFGDGTLTILDGATNQVIKRVYVGPQLTYVGVNTLTNRVYVVSYGSNGLFIIDGASDRIIRMVPAGSPAGGSFGLAVNEVLDRVYVSNRDSRYIATFDGEGNLLANQQIRPNPSSAVPFSLGFNPNTNKLYVMLAAPTVVDRVQVYETSPTGLGLVTTVPLDPGGLDAGGGVTVNTANNHVFVTNSSSNTVGVIDGLADRLLIQVPVGEDPFGVAANPVTGLIYVGNRDGDHLTVIMDF
jgi:YVTN family beta-propeller protein